MKEESIKLIKATLDNWRIGKNYTFQQKNISVGKSPIVEGEYILKFDNTLHGFICKGKEIQISITSKPFHTTKLSNSPLSENVNSDKLRLEKILKEFDEEFDSKVNEKLTECDDIVYTSDPLFF
jgi:hypothetical protein